jgi:hypothetical protein
MHTNKRSRNNRYDYPFQTRKTAAFALPCVQHARIAHILQVLDQSIPRQLTGAAIRATFIRKAESWVSSLDDYFERSCLKFTEHVTSSNRLRFGRQMLPASRSSTEPRSTRTSYLKADMLWDAVVASICMEKCLGHTELRHRSDRFQWGMRHRLARRDRRLIGISRLHLQPGYFFEDLFHRKQRRLPPIPH